MCSLSTPVELSLAVPGWHCTSWNDGNDRSAARHGGVFLMRSTALLEDRPDETDGGLTRVDRQRHRQRHFRRRRLMSGGALILAVVLLWTGVSLIGALTNPALGSSAGARLAE